MTVVIPLLALTDGVLHFALDFLLFRGRIWGSPGRPPGAPVGGTPPGPPPGGGPPLPLPLPLNELFALNLAGYVVLVALFLVATRSRPGRRIAMDLVLMFYVALVVLGWLDIGRPNPLGLGLVTKLVEAALALLLLAHIRLLFRARRATRLT